MNHSGIKLSAILTLSNLVLFFTPNLYVFALVGIAATSAIYFIAFRSGAYFFMNAGAMALSGIAVVTLNQLAGGTFDDLGSISELRIADIEAVKLWACLVAIALAIAVQQFYFFVRGLFHDNSDVEQIVPILLSTTNCGLIVSVRLFYPIIEAFHSKFLYLLNTGAASGLLILSVMTLFSHRPRQLLVNLMAIQSSIVLLGFIQPNAMSASGARIIWITALLTGASFGLCINLLEARVGIGSFQAKAVAFEKMPRLAFMFFFFGMAMVDFPGTLGFIGEDLLVHGVLGQSAISGFIVLLTMASASIAIYRCFVVGFTGRRLGPDELTIDLRRSEALVLATFAILIVGFNLFPQLVIADGPKQQLSSSANSSHSD